MFSICAQCHTWNVLTCSLFPVHHQHDQREHDLSLPGMLLSSGSTCSSSLTHKYHLCSPPTQGRLSSPSVQLCCSFCLNRHNFNNCRTSAAVLLLEALREYLDRSHTDHGCSVPDDPPGSATDGRQVRPMGVCGVSRLCVSLHHCVSSFVRCADNLSIHTKCSSHPIGCLFPM